MPAVELTPRTHLMLQHQLVVEQLRAHRDLLLWICFLFSALLVIDDAGIIQVIEGFVCFCFSPERS